MATCNLKSSLLSIIKPSNLKFLTATKRISPTSKCSEVITLLFVMNIINVFDQLMNKRFKVQFHSVKTFKPALKFETTFEIEESLNNKVVSSAKSLDNILMRKTANL